MMGKLRKKQRSFYDAFVMEFPAFITYCNIANVHISYVYDVRFSPQYDMIYCAFLSMMLMLPLISLIIHRIVKEEKDVKLVGKNQSIWISEVRMHLSRLSMILCYFFDYRFVAIFDMNSIALPLPSSSSLSPLSSLALPLTITEGNNYTESQLNEAIVFTNSSTIANNIKNDLQPISSVSSSLHWMMYGVFAAQVSMIILIEELLMIIICVVWYFTPQVIDANSSRNVLLKLFAKAIIDVDETRVDYLTKNYFYEKKSIDTNKEEDEVKNELMANQAEPKSTTTASSKKVMRMTMWKRTKKTLNEKLLDSNNRCEDFILINEKPVFICLDSLFNFGSFTFLCVILASSLTFINYCSPNQFIWSKILASIWLAVVWKVGWNELSVVKSYNSCCYNLDGRDYVNLLRYLAPCYVPKHMRRLSILLNLFCFAYSSIMIAQLFIVPLLPALLLFPMYLSMFLLTNLTCLFEFYSYTQYNKFIKEVEANSETNDRRRRRQIGIFERFLIPSHQMRKISIHPMMMEKTILNGLVIKK